MIVKNEVVMRYKKLSDKAETPQYSSENAAGLDLYAVVHNSGDVCTIPPKGVAKIGTDIAVEIPEGCFGAVFARSGLATKEGLRPANCVGVIDSDYRGEVIVPLYNDSTSDKTITTGTRIAQLVIMPYLRTSLKETEELSDTKRGEGGFGSTGN